MEDERCYRDVVRGQGFVRPGVGVEPFRAMAGEAAGEVGETLLHVHADMAGDVCGELSATRL